MLNLRTLQNFQPYLPILLRQVKYSSSNKDSKDQHIDDKITTEKFRMLRSYIHDKDVKLEEKIISVLETQQGPWTDQVTNVTGSQLEEEKLQAEKYSVKGTTSSTINNNSQHSQDILNYSKNLESHHFERKNVSILNNQSTENIEPIYKYPMDQADLTLVGLPITLHIKDDNILVAAMLQDVEQMYRKTAKVVNRCYLSSHQFGLLWYKTLKISLQDHGQIKNLLHKNSLTILINKSNIWLTDSKPATDPVTPPKDDKMASDSENPIDKIKKMIENLINSMKQKVEEKKKSMEEKK